MASTKLTDPRRAHQEGEHPALMEALIQATEQLLDEHGPEGVTTIRIATRAGVSLTTLMQCFRNRDAIVAEALERRRAKAQRRAPPAAAPPRAAPPRAAPPRAAPPRAQAAVPPVRRAPAPPAASNLFRTPPPPPASTLFRTPATTKARNPAPTPAMFRLPDPPSRPPPAPETLEDAMLTAVRPLVAAFAEHLPAMKGMPQADKDAITRVELKRMAKASEAVLARHDASDPAHLAHVMTLSCDKVIKDAIRHSPESFSDGRLEQALCRLCLDFVRS